MKTKVLPLLVILFFLISGINMVSGQTVPCLQGLPIGCCPCTGCAPITQLPQICVHETGPLTIPVTISGPNFIDIAAISLKMDFDPTILQYTGPITAPFLPSGATPPIAGQPNGPGSLVISWYYNGGGLGSGWYLNSGQTLFLLQFNVLAPGVTNINWNLTESSYTNVDQVINFTSNILCQNANNYLNGRVDYLTASMQQPLSTCQSAPIQIMTTHNTTSSPYTHYWTGTGAPYLSSTTASDPYFMSATPGTYTLRDSITDGFGCWVIITGTVTVKPTPTCNITGPAPVCGGTTNTYNSGVTPSGGTVTHLWSITGDGIITGPIDGPSITVIAGASGSYTVSDIVFRDGCPSNCSKTVTVNANPTGTIAGPTPVCGGTTNTYTTTVLPSGGTVTHAWTVTGNGTIQGSSTGASVVIVAGTSGMYTIVDNFMRNNCPGTQSKIVTINQVPTCSIQGADSVCIQSTTTYTSNVNPLEGTITHAWSITGNGTLSGPTNQPTVNVIATANGNFTLTDNVVRNGCSTSCTKVVVVKPTPTTPCITGPDPVCGATISSYTDVISPAGGVVTHYWTITGAGQLLGQGNEIVPFWVGPVARVLAGASGTFTLTDAFTREGCPGTITRTITVNPVPTCSITPTAAVCDNATTTYTSAVLPTGGTVVHSWTITGNGVIQGSATGATVTVHATGPGTYTIQDDITRNGCASSCSQTITVNANPTCTIDGPDAVCYGTTNTHANVVSPAGGTVTHSWSITGSGTLVPPTNGPVATVTAGASGTYTITDNITRNGCAGSCNKTVTINPMPTCNITGPDSLCDGANGTFTGNVLSGAGTTLTYAWSISGNGTIIGSTTSATVVVEAGPGAGTFTLSLMVTRNGCAAQQPCTKTVKVNPIPVCNITGPGTVCYLAQGYYTYTSNVTPGTGIITHNWTITGNGAISGSVTGASVMVTIPNNAAGTFTLCDAISRNGCTSSCCYTVTVNPIPTCTITGPLELCQLASGVYSNVVLPAGGTVEHNWVVTGNGSISGSNTGPTVTVIAGNAVGTGSGSFILTDNITRNGSTSSCNITVTVNVIPTCSIAGPGTLCGTAQETYTSTVLPSGGLVTHSWTITGAGGSINGATNTASVDVIANNVDGTFTLTDNITRNGCTSTCTKCVTVYKQPVCTVAGPDSICAGKVATFTSSVVPSTGTITHAWNIVGDGYFTSATNTATVTVMAGASGAYTVTDEIFRNNCYTLCSKIVNIKPTPVITCGTLISSPGTDHIATGPWTQMNGTCFDYNLCISLDPQLPYFYFGVQAITSSQPLKVNYLNGFKVTAISDPTTFFAYWATRGITAASTAPYNYLWQILNGQQPWFYVKKYSNGSYKLIDGWANYLVTHGYGGLNTNTDTVLRAMGDFPTEVLTFKGTYTSISNCPSDSLTLLMRLNQKPVCSIDGPLYVCPQQAQITYTAPPSLNYQWSITGNGTIVGSSVQQTVVVNALGTGQYTLTLQLTNPQTLCQSTCSVIVNVQNRSLSGYLGYPMCPPSELTTPMNNVTLGLVPVPGTTPIQTAITNAGGFFTFTGLCAGDYTISVVQNTKPTGGINSTDAAQTLHWPGSNHAIEMVRFNGGDVYYGVGSGTGDKYFIGAEDAHRIQMHFVFGTPFNAPLWSYWKRGEMAYSNLNPSPIPTSWKITLPANADLTGVQLLALVTGDFDQSFIPNSTKNASDNLNLIVENTTYVKENQEFDLPVRAVTEMDITAVSLIVNIPSSLIEVKDVLINGSNNNVSYNIEGDQVTIGWYSDEPVHLADNATVILLKLKTTAAFVEGTSFRMVLAGNPLNELADAEASPIPHALLSVDKVANSAVGVNDQSSENINLTCHPNPFRDYSTISYVLPDRGNVTLDVLNMVGQVITNCVNEAQDAGKHSIRVSSATMPSGVYMAVLKFRNGSNEIVKTIRVVVNK